MAKKSNKFVLSSTVELDVVATLGERVRITSMTLAEYKTLKAKHSAWHIQAYQKGFHAYKATE